MEATPLANPAGAADRWLPVAVLALVAAIYAPSLAGGWVWDDVYQFQLNPAITQPGVLLSQDIWTPTGFASPGQTPAYRPLAMLSHAPGQILWPGPAVERIWNLALHLAIVAGVAALALAMGASRRAAWFGAALLGCHPAASEGVAWISSRGDLMGTGLLLFAVLASIRGFPLRAGLCLALAPFCKESFVLAPLAFGIWMLALRRKDWRPAAIGLAGGGAYLLIRLGLGFSVPSDGAVSGAGEALGAIGAVAVRGLSLLVDPTAPDAVPVFEAAPWAGGVALGIGLSAFLVLPGRPALGALLASLPLLALAAPASFANGIIADRYFYASAASLAVAAALAFHTLESRRQWTPLLFLLPLCLAPVTSLRASEWSSNEHLFGASLARNPNNPHAQFHVAYDLHTRKSDCATAIPLYQSSMAVIPRSGNNLQSCLITTGRLEEAAALGPELTQRDRHRKTPALNTGRALALLGRAAEAEPWVREALRREPDTAKTHRLLGNVLGMQRRYAAAVEHFERALELAPGDPEALRGAAQARRLASAGAETAARAPGPLP